MGCLSVNIRDDGCHLQVGCGLANPLLQVKNTLLNPPLQVNCSLVCSVNDNYFLYVEPDVVWITEGMLSGEFEILSNVSWKIE